MKQPAHITISAEPWCVWTGCAAGAAINKAEGYITCGQPSLAAAKRAAAKLAPHFRKGAVRVVRGACPHDERSHNVETA